MVKKQTTPKELDIIVRLHDVRKTFELERCLLSLICQDYRPLSVYVVTQRFTASATATINSVVQSLSQIDPTVRIKTSNYNKAGSPDARSALINQGIAISRGRYLGFLDYDDVIHDGAYKALVDVLQGCCATAAFGKIRAKSLEVQADIFMARSCRDIYSRHLTVIDQFLDNHFPIHSFVLDRTRIDAKDLFFDENLSRLEDYDFLIRLCAKYPIDLCLQDKIVGDYNIKDDGSNTVLRAAEADIEVGQRVAWEAARLILFSRRAQTEVSVEVQRRLRLGPIRPELTVGEMMKNYHSPSNSPNSILQETRPA